MPLSSRFSGLSPTVPTPPLASDAGGERLTDEAAVTFGTLRAPRIDVILQEDVVVAQGAPVARLRKHPEIALTAPMPGRIASISLKPGHRLDQIILFLEADADRYRHKTIGADTKQDDTRLRALLQGSGLWLAFLSRPFARLPAPAERPAAIFIMASDTRPLAPDPRKALEGRDEAFSRGLSALLRLCDGPVFVCQSEGEPLVDADNTGGRLRIVRTGARHPHGQAGFQIHRLHPARIDAPVWDIHAEDVAAIGALLATGYLPGTRLVSVAGPALTETRLVRCQPGANLKGLCHGAVRPGPYTLLNGSPLEGREAEWLGPRDRQVSVMPRKPHTGRKHWFRAALTKAARPLPIIPTAALDEAMGGAVPTVALVRALSSGDQETAVRLGALSFVAEDLALADYVTAAEPRLSALLAGMLARIEAEEGA
ncbi:Na(+)-translocating NADH-quinone reductase subunit A [Breoghania sp. JC706]|uniref:Na(+)-translocating NADH-quinone reductase subunit A n=1 Tax=Breoghania sp. JC706 TaxID=3117732 RepID=UPI003009D1F9